MASLLQRGVGPALGFTYACVPLFPAFITLTNVSFPGVSVVPAPIVAVVLGLMICAAIYAVVILSLPQRDTPMPMLLPIGAWFGAALLSAVLGFNPRDGLIFVCIFGLGIAWHATIMRYYAAPGVARMLYIGYLGSAVVALAAAIAMVLTRVPAAQYTIGHGRAIGTFILPGELAGYLIFVLPLAYALARIAQTQVVRVLAWSTLGLGAIAMLLTFSRTGWTGLACAVAFLVAMRARGRAGLLTGGAVVVAALAVVLLFFNEHHNPSENYTRLSIWQASLGVIDRFPLTGVGPFGFSHVYPLVRLPDGDATAFHAHSVYLTFLAELGIVGMAGVSWAGWRFAQVLRSALRTASPQATELALAIAAGLVGTLVQGVIDTVSVAIFGLWLPTMALALVAARYGTAEA